MTTVPTTPQRDASLLDFVNILLDNDRIADDLKRVPTREGGPERAEGVDVAALPVDLQHGGATAFVKSWNDLMARIDSKRVAIRKAS